MKSEDCITRASSSQSEWSQEHHIYYYSRFDLFGHEAEQEFYQFSLFGEKISSELGRDWHSESAFLYYPYLTSKQVFANLLQLWLRYHPPVNSMRSSQPAPVFNSDFVSEFDQTIQIYLQANHRAEVAKPSALSLKAVCLGFYMTANQIWEELFQNSFERRKEAFSASSFFKGVTATIEKTFKPLMVVTQKISSVFGQKKRKLNEELSGDCGEEKFQSCYNEFRRAMDLEKQLERKLSDFDLKDCEVVSSRRVEKKEFAEEECPMQPGLLSSVYSYVTDFLHRNPSWQVASSFVTQILDINQVQLEEGKKVKVMRPAQDFYRKLVIVWLVCAQAAKEPFSFEDYLQALKTTYFAGNWEERLTLPTKYFFEQMRVSWEDSKKENEGSSLIGKQTLDDFINRLNGSLSQDWNRKIKIRKD